MKFTPKKIALFVIFAIYLVQLAYRVVTTGNIRYVTSNISTILLLGALYLPRSEQSRFVVVLSVAYIAVNQFIDLVMNINTLLNLSTLFSLILIAGLIYFAVIYFRSSVFSLNEKTIISVLVGLSLVRHLTQILRILPILISQGRLDFLTLSIPLIQISVLIYLWIKEKPDNYNYY